MTGEEFLKFRHLYREYMDELVRLRVLPYGQTMNYNPTGGKSRNPWAANDQPATLARTMIGLRLRGWLVVPTRKGQRSSSR